MLAAREMLLRGGHVAGRRTLALGPGAHEFPGTRGDPWDTRSGMSFAMIGATVSLPLPSRWHDRQLDALRPR